MDIETEENLIRLIEQYENLVFSICFNITKHYFDAQDLTQETFLSVYRNWESFDGNNEKAWICRIATNKGLDYLKQAGRRSAPMEDAFFLSIENQSPSVEEAILEKDTKARLLKLCRQLKPPYDKIAASYFYKEMTVAEIALSQQKKAKTVQTQIYRAKAMLKKLWRKEC